MARYVADLGDTRDHLGFGGGRRGRVLACPICKKLHGDASLVPNGEVCHGGHILINNVKKMWQCQQVLLVAPALTPDTRAVLPSASRACRSTGRG